MRCKKCHVGWYVRPQGLVTVHIILNTRNNKRRRCSGRRPTDRNCEGSILNRSRKQIRVADTMSCLLRSPSVRQLRQSLVARRSYHDESFGFRKPRGFELPDCELSLLPVNMSDQIPVSRLPHTAAESSHKCASPPICRLITHSRASCCTH